MLCGTNSWISCSPAWNRTTYATSFVNLRTCCKPFSSARNRFSRASHMNRSYILRILNSRTLIFLVLPYILVSWRDPDAVQQERTASVVDILSGLWHWKRVCAQCWRELLGAGRRGVACSVLSRRRERLLYARCQLERKRWRRGAGSLWRADDRAAAADAHIERLICGAISKALHARALCRGRAGDAFDARSAHSARESECTARARLVTLTNERQRRRRRR